MSRSDRERLEDILTAIGAIREHVKRGSLKEGIVFDAVRMRLLEIGEAVKALPPELLARVPQTSWVDIVQMRDRLAHRYFDSAHVIIESTVDHDLPELEKAVGQLLEEVG